MEKSGKRIRRIAVAAAVFLTALFVGGRGNVHAAAAGPAAGSEAGSSQKEAAALRREYKAWQQRLSGIEKEADIAKNGFAVLEEQVFLVELANLGEVRFIPALDEGYRRLALFFADEAGNIVFRTDQLEMNFVNTGRLAQPNREVSAVSFQDVNGDGLEDILLIASCAHETAAQESTFLVGEVLFADEDGFYRDWRISDKLNRFAMNKSIDFMVAYVRDGKSTEFLYTATTMQELSARGGKVIAEQSYAREFEKLGRLVVVPYSIVIADYEIFMIYLINEQGAIVWSFQPMGAHDNLYALRGISCRDIDGDGLKDIVVLARYSDGIAPKQQIVSDYAIYYQRTGGFSEDAEFKGQFLCDEDTKMEELVRAARSFWGYVDEEGL